MRVLSLLRPIILVLETNCVLVCLATLVIPVQGQKPELFVQTGHALAVTSIALSSDGQILASGSDDTTVKLWHIPTGRELRVLRGHSNKIRSVAFSPDDRILATSGDDNTVKVWETKTGASLLTLRHSSWWPFVMAVAFSGDGTILASGDAAKNIQLWDVASGRARRKLNGHSGIISSLAFIHPGKILASGSEDGTVRLWNISTGHTLNTLVGHSGPVHSIAVTVDGKILASAGEDKTIKLWDISSGRQLTTLRGHSSQVRSVAFSGDGRTLASAAFDSTCKLWSVATGREIATIKGRLLGKAVALSADGQTLAGSYDNMVKLWSVDTQLELRTLEGHAQQITPVAIGSYKNMIAAGRADPAIKFWDTASDGGLRTLIGHSQAVRALAFSPDGKLLASGGLDGTLRLWDTTTGRQLNQLAHSSRINSIAFSSDGKTIVSNDNKAVKLFDVASGAIRTLVATESEINGVAFSPAGQTLASANVNSIKLWDLSSGRVLRSFPSGGGSKSLAFSNDAKILASGGFDGITRLLDITSGQLVDAFTKHADQVNSLAFSPDGKVLATCSIDKTIKLWDVLSGRELKTLREHSQIVWSIAFSPDGTFLISGSSDATMKLWRVATGELVATMIALDQTDWMVVTPDGLFDGSPNAWRQILWRFSSNLFDVAPAEIFFNEFFYPGLLTDIFAGKTPSAPRSVANIDRRQPHVTLASAEPQVSTSRNLTTRTIRVRVEASSIPADKDHQNPSGVRDIRVFRNGSLVKAWRGDAMDPGERSGCRRQANKVSCETNLQIVAGENRLTAYAFNNDNVKSNDASWTVVGDDALRREGTFYILAIGIDKYANPRQNLNYAVSDAEDFSAEVLSQQLKLKQYASTRVIRLTNQESTRENLLYAIRAFSLGKAAPSSPVGVPDSLRNVPALQPEDALLIFFAGHGKASGDRFYLIPHDFVSGGKSPTTSSQLDQLLQRRAISDLNLESALERVDAGNLLMIIDACESGQALEAQESRRGPINSKGLAQLAYEKGMYILTASQSYQAALEVSRLRHGLLTFALLSGLKDARADIDGDGSATARELFNYASEQVPRLQLEEMKKYEAAQGAGRKGRKRLIFVPGDENIADPEQRNLQRPRLFYRRELEARPLLVARP